MSSGAGTKSDTPLGVDPARVGEWLDANVDGARGPYRFEVIAGGHSNLTFSVVGGDGRAMVLRRPPLSHVFVVLTLLFVGVWMGIAFGLPPLPQPSAEHSAPGQLWSQAAQGFRTIFRHPEFARMFPFAFVTYGGFLAMHGLWLGPWFTEVEGQTPGQAATGLLILTAVIMIARLQKRRRHLRRTSNF